MQKIEPAAPDDLAAMRRAEQGDARLVDEEDAVAGVDEYRHGGAIHHRAVKQLHIEGRFFVHATSSRSVLDSLPALTNARGHSSAPPPRTPRPRPRRCTVASVDPAASALPHAAGVMTCPHTHDPETRGSGPSRHGSSRGFCPLQTTSSKKSIEEAWRNVITTATGGWRTGAFRGPGRIVDERVYHIDTPDTDLA